MSVMARRAEVAKAITTQHATSDFQQWLRDHPMARDADGDYVMLQFAADEATSTLMDEVAAFDHPVMVSTIFDRGVLSWVLGGPLEGTGPTAPNPIPVDEKLTVGDLASAILDAQAIGAALEFVLVRSGPARMLVSV